MTPAAPPACPRCHAPIPPYAPAGLCPMCLLVAPVSAGERTEADAAGPLEAGARLRYVGDYELLEEVARGGMGVVFRARQVSLDRIVAIKMLLSGALADAATVQRFLREAEAAASLQHPNIVAIHEVGRAGDQHYFSMDYVDGPSLAAVLAQGPLSAPRAAKLVSTIALAVDHAHRRGILHRDLKPHNVLMAGDEPRVADFGLARSIDGAGRLTETGTVLGSPCYMPPEQALGRTDQVGPASDVYGLGAILYEALVGRPPFVGESSAAIVRRVIDEPPAPPSRVDPRIPRDLETICLACLDKDPARRYPSARALADDLDRFGRGEPIAARRPGAVRRAWSAMARQPWKLCAIAAALLLVAAGAIYGLVIELEHVRWTHAHPGEVVVPGRYTQPAERAGTVATFVILLLVYASGDLSLRARQGGWKRFNETFHVDLDLPERPLPLGLLAGYGALGAGAIAFAFVLAGRIIEAWVWEGALSWTLVLMSMYPCVWLGLALIAQAARHHHRGLRGLHTEPPVRVPAAIAVDFPREWGRFFAIVFVLVLATGIAAWRFPAVRGLVPWFAASASFGLSIVLATRLRRPRVGSAVVFLAMFALFVMILAGGPVADGQAVAMFAGGLVGLVCMIGDLRCWGRTLR